MKNLAEKQRAMKERNLNLKTLKKKVSYNDRVAAASVKSARTVLIERNKVLDNIQVPSLEETVLSPYDLDFFEKEHFCKFCKVNKTSVSKSRGEILPCRSCAKLKIRLALYRLTLEDYWSMWNDQAGRCALCDEDMVKPHIDHCHDLLHVRGLLCARCNMGLGQFKDNCALLRRAATYIEKNNLERKWWVQKDQ